MGRLQCIATILLVVVAVSPEAALAAKHKKKAAPPPAPVADTEPPVIEHIPPSPEPDATLVTIRAHISDPGGVFEPTLVVRQAGAAYARVEMTPVDGSAEDFEAQVPPELLQGDIEYFIEAFDKNGNGPARAGSEEAPIRVARPQPPTPPLAPSTQHPAVATTSDADADGGNTGLWIGLGVAAGVAVLLGAGVAVGLIAYTSREKAPESTRVGVSAPVPVQALWGAP